MNQLHGMPKLINLPTLIITLIGLLLAASSGRNCRADISLPKFFSDHMVLQQQAQFPVWGVAEPEQKLVVRFNGNERKTTADKDGKFSVSIETPVAGGPYQLEVVDEQNAAGVILDDVMVGEVWLCAGQTNMNWPVEKSEDAPAEILSANNYNQIRLFTVEVHASDKPLPDAAKANPWTICSADNVKDFSAVAFFFGRDLAKTLEDTPIGLIDASCEGGRCESWCSTKSLESANDLAPLLKYWSEIERLNDRQRPGSIFNGMISPLVRYPLRGVIWYQGETNVGRGKQYATLLPTLIADWRQQFNAPNLPFYMAQLAPYRYSDYPIDALPEVWDVQLKTAQTDANAAVATTMDLGSESDLHPPNKQSVGKRLAILALSKTYQSKLPVEATNGPVYKSMEAQSNCIRIEFDNWGGGLKNLSETDMIESFLVCGDDKVFHPAVVKDVGENWVDIVCPQVKTPLAVRYCWDDTAVSRLGNSDDLPAFPFRTDDFELSSDDAQF